MFEQGFVPEKYVYGGAGTSVSVLIELTGALDSTTTFHLPGGKMSFFIFRENPAPPKEIVSHFRRFLPDLATLKGRKILLIDYVEGAEGLEIVRRWIQGMGYPVETLGFVHPEGIIGKKAELRYEFRQSKFDDPADFFRHRMTNMGHHTVILSSESQFQRFSRHRYRPYATHGHVPLTNLAALSNITQQPLFKPMSDLVQARLRQDASTIRSLETAIKDGGGCKLDTALQARLRKEK